MSNPYKGEARSTGASKGRSMGVRNDFMPDRAVKISGSSPRGSYPMPDQHANQMPEDKHAAGYENDTSGWVKGAGESAEGKPGFDHSKKSG